MILIEVVLVVISVTPSIINGIYGLVATGIVKNEDEQAKESFALTIVTVLFYCYFAV
jgi:hypothetical protein